MRRSTAAWLILMAICVAAGGVLGFTNELTRAPIAANAALVADNARGALFPAADEFAPVALADGSALDNCYAALGGGEPIGYIAQATVQGFGGPIEVLVGMDTAGTLTGVNVGGESFSETPGLGAKTKEAAFTSQFAGVAVPVTLGADVDAVTSATISSTAVTNAVNQAGEYLLTLTDANKTASVG